MIICSAFPITQRIFSACLCIATLLLSLPTLAQPTNDLPCDAIDLGAVETQQTITFSGNNRNASSENTSLTSSCLGDAGWGSTVFYRFALDAPFIKGARVTLAPTSDATLNMALMTIETCGGEGAWFEGSDVCNITEGDTVFTGFTCRERTEFLIIIGSQTTSAQGDFDITIDPVEPTYCDDCQNGDETEVDGPFRIADDTVVPAVVGAANGAYAVNEMQGGTPPFRFSVDGGPFQNNGNFDDLAAGNYTLIVVDDNSCGKTFPFTIPSIDTIAPPSINSPILACEGEQIPEAMAAGLNIRWYADEGLTELVATGEQFSPTNVPDTLYVTQTISDIESTPIPFFISLREGKIPVEIVASVLTGYAPLLVNFEVNSDSTAADFFWDFGDGEQAISPSPFKEYTEEGDYTVTLNVTDADGCTNTDSVTISVLLPIEVATGISPNGDGVNDLWEIRNLEDAPPHSIKVYNQWGNLVFESEDYRSDWDGEGIADGTYFYAIEFEDNQLPAINGYLMVLR